VEELVLHPLIYAGVAVYTLRGVVRVLRDCVELRNEWYRRER
jgi:hypothetical protein